jgi:hypothetical protein
MHDATGFWFGVFYTLNTVFPTDPAYNAMGLVPTGTFLVKFDAQISDFRKVSRN